MNSSSKHKRYTPQEYYALERAAWRKSDYFDGQIFEIWPGSVGESPFRHDLIASNLVRELGNRLQGKACCAYGSNRRLTISATSFECHPDVGIYCSKLERDLDDRDTEAVCSPTVLIEVLSYATEGDDRGFKAENYRQIESLRAYIFVSQSSPHAEVYRRELDGDWKFHEVKGLDGKVAIPGVGVALTMAEIYDRVSFPKNEKCEEEPELGR